MHIEGKFKNGDYRKESSISQGGFLLLPITDMSSVLKTPIHLLAKMEKILYLADRKCHFRF